MNNTDNFKALIDAEGNEDLKSKAEAAAAIVIQRASEFGAMLTVEDTYALNFTRLLAHTGQEIGDLQNEIETATPQGRKIAEDRELMAAVNAENGDVKRKREAEEALQAELNTLSPTERMKRGRALLGAAALPGRLTGSSESKTLTADEKAYQLAELEKLPASLRMARFREVFG